MGTFIRHLVEYSCLSLQLEIFGKGPFLKLEKYAAIFRPSPWFGHRLPNNP